jgi:hypothetical protein
MLVSTADESAVMMEAAPENPPRESAAWMNAINELRVEEMAGG